MMMMKQLLMLCIVCSYIDRLMLLLSDNVTSLTDDQFIFSGKHFYSAVSSTPQFSDHFQQRSAADTDSDADLIQFNVSSTSSGYKHSSVCAFLSGTDLISLLIFFLLLFFFLLGRPLQKAQGAVVSNRIGTEFKQDCFFNKYASIDAVGFLIQSHNFEMAAPVQQRPPVPDLVYSSML